MKRSSVLYILIVWIFSLGFVCDSCRDEDFKITIANRDSHQVTAIVNGNVVTTIPAGEAQEVVVTLRTDDGSPTSSSSSQFAYIAFNARRTDTGELSRGKQMQVRTDRPNYVQVDKWDFSP